MGIITTPITTQGIIISTNHIIRRDIINHHINIHLDVISIIMMALRGCLQSLDHIVITTPTNIPIQQRDITTTIPIIIDIITGTIILTTVVITTMDITTTTVISHIHRPRVVTM